MVSVRKNSKEDKFRLGYRQISGLSYMSSSARQISIGFPDESDEEYGRYSIPTDELGFVRLLVDKPLRKRVIQQIHGRPTEISKLKAQLSTVRRELNKIKILVNPTLSAAALGSIVGAFSQIEHVLGVYASVKDGREIVITYPDSVRIGEMLKRLVPIEVELSRRYTNTPIEFQYFPASEFLDDVRSSYKVLWEGEELHPSAV